MKKSFLLLSFVALFALWPTFMTVRAVDPVPAVFQDLYDQMEADLDDFNETLDSQWDGTENSVVFSAELIPAHYSNQSIVTNPTYLADTVEPWLDRFVTLGVDAVRVAIHFPVLTQSYWDNASYGNDSAAYTAYLSFYNALETEIRSRGLKLIVWSTIAHDGTTDQTGNWPPNLSAYYQSLDFTAFKTARSNHIKTIVSELSPDYITIQGEPEVEAQDLAGTSYQSQITLPGTNASMIGFFVGDLNTAGLHTTVKVGAGVGSWLAAYAPYVNSLNAIPTLDYISIHVYPINNESSNYLDRILTIADLAQAAGKLVVIDEMWPNKWRNADLGVANSDTIAARNVYSFWKPIDQYFLRTMVKTAHLENMAYINPFWSRYFFYYLDYYNISGCAVPPDVSCTASGLNVRSSSASATAAAAGASTETGSAYQNYITSGYLFPDITAPSTPASLTVAEISSSQVSLTWGGSSEVPRTGYATSGLSGYDVYRDGVIVGSSSIIPSYTDEDLASETVYSYTIVAKDAEGNNSSQSSSVVVTTLSPASSQPASGGGGGGGGTNVVVSTSTLPGVIITPGLSPTTIPFGISTKVETTANVNVRSAASTLASIIAVKSTGATGAITAGPTLNQGYSWYQITYDDGVNGWSAGDYLKVIAAAPIAVSAPIVTTVSEVERENLIKEIQTQLITLINQLITLLAEQIQNTPSQVFNAVQKLWGIFR